ncbi:MAG: gfo/Idh/MocA family oxidoreductase, partial [Planctomycetaceae bacterium]|nr:gfo/Idh/MocA family oxidoreductase [Planctomycetaceae bacterium]
MFPTRRELLQQVSAASLLAALPGTAPGQNDASKPRIKVGQIGVGHAHASKLSVYRSSPDYEV